jgi:hypothetical protein
MKGEGDCYEAAAKLLYAHRSCADIVLVHGTVTGQGPIAGIRYGHAWIEIGDVVLDPSNGRFVCARKADYYAVGEINEPVTRYAFEEAARQMLETRHYGPWEKRLPQSGENDPPCLINEAFRDLPIPLLLHSIPIPADPPKNGEKIGWTQRG